MDLKASFRNSRSLLAATLIVTGISSSVHVAGREPVDDFLAALQQQRLYAEATQYLAYAQQHNLLDAEQSKNIELLRLELLQSEIPTLATAADKKKRITEIEKGYSDFLANNPQHERRGEVRIKLGDLYLLQGENAKQEATATSNEDEKNTNLKASRDAFAKAEKLFTDGVQELFEPLKAMLGANIDPKNQDAIAQRERMQTEYRRSQILIGVTRKLQAETYPVDSPEYKDFQTKAEQQFDEVSKKASRTSEAGAYYVSVLYRGQAQAALKKINEATESLLRVADLQETGILRKYRVDATTSLVKLLASPEGNKLEVAVQRGDELLRQAAETELLQPEWQELQVATWQAKRAWAESLKAKNQEGQAKSITNDLRDELTKIARTQSPVADKARELLTEMGVEVSAPKLAEVPRVRDFESAFKEANERISQREKNKQTITLLKNQFGDNSPNSGQIQNQIAQLEADVKTLELQAIELYQRSFTLFSTSVDSRDDLVTARFRYAYLKYESQSWWDAAAAADLSARTNPGTQIGQDSCRIALAAYQTISTDAAEGMKPTKALESLANFALVSWPNSELSIAAAATVLQQAVTDGRFDDAQKAIEALKGADPKTAGAAQRDIGFMLYHRQFLPALKAARESGQTIEQTGANTIRDNVMSLLKDGTESLKADELNERAVEAANALADLYMQNNNTSDALTLLNKEVTGPMTVVRAGTVALLPTTKMESLRLLLQAEVSDAIQNNKALNPSAIQEIVTQMQAVAKGDGANPALLTQALVVLANDLKSKLDEASTPADKQKLAAGQRLLLSQLLNVSQDVSTLAWASNTLLNLSTAIKEDQQLRSLADSMAQDSVTGYEKVNELITKAPEELTKLNIQADDLKQLIANAYRASGQYEKASALYAEVLASNSMKLLVQIDAAKNLDEWGRSTNKDEIIRQAIFGTQPNAKKDNIIWGWKKIGDVLNRSMIQNVQLEPFFFESRYSLANSLAAVAELKATPEEKKKEYTKAIQAIRSTYINYPKLGSPATLQKFDDLTKRVQSQIGDNAVGLSGL